MTLTLGKLGITSNGKKFISTINDADVVIHAPGGPIIGDIYAGKYGMWEIYVLFRLMIPIIKNKPLFFYAPSMGPFSGIFKNAIRKFILKRTNPIILRDSISSFNLKTQLKLNSYVTLDSAFQNDIPFDYLKKYQNIQNVLNLVENEKVVGMTLTDLQWHSMYNNDSKIKNEIKTSLIGTINYIINKGYFVLFIPQLFGMQEKLEMPFLEEIRDSLNSDMIKILPQKLDSYAQQAIISKLFCIIGMRYHPNIFASKNNIPFVAISYEHKMEGFIEKIRCEDLIIDVHELNEENLINKFTYLEENYGKIKKRLEDQNLKLKKESQMTTDIIINELKKLNLQ